MANYATLKTAIQQVVRTNGNNEITGALLQQSLLAMVDSLGAFFQFAGVAVPSTNPGTPDQNIFYIAGTAGTYSNIGGFVLNDGEFGVFLYNGTWQKYSFPIGKDYDAQIAQLAASVAILQSDINNVIVSPNKFIPGDVRTGGMYLVNAVWMSGNSFFSTGFIPVNPGDTVLIKWGIVPTTAPQGNWTAFQQDKQTSAGGGQANIQFSAGQYQFTVPTAWSTTKYITIGFAAEIDMSTIEIIVNGNTQYAINENVLIAQASIVGLAAALAAKQNTLTAGANITIDSNNVISAAVGAVLFNAVQTLTNAQKQVARANIDAAALDDVQIQETETKNVAVNTSSWAYGYVRPNGTIQTASSGSWRYSDKIPIVDGTPITVNRLYCNTAVATLAAYDANDNFISECSICQSTSISASAPVTIQTTGKNVAYIRITAGGGYPDYSVVVTQLVGTKTLKQVLAEIQAEIDNIGIGVQWSGKSWVALGTSITDTNNTLAPDGTATGKFVPKLVALSGLNVTNKGVAGSVIGGHILYYAGHTQEMATAKLVTIEGGVNDWAGNRALGNVGDTVPYLIEWTSPVWNNGGSVDGTFAGACYQAIKTAMENAPEAVIVVVTDNTGQHITSTGADCSREKKNTLGLTQYDYTNMLVEVAKYMGVPVINAGQKSLINQDNPEYLIDQIHQTELGGEQFATVIWSELKNIANRVIE